MTDDRWMEARVKQSLVGPWLFGGTLTTDGRLTYAKFQHPETLKVISIAVTWAAASDRASVADQIIDDGLQLLRRVRAGAILYLHLEPAGAADAANRRRRKHQRQPLLHLAEFS